MAILALFGSARTERAMGLQFGQRNHLTTHVTHTFHVRAELKVGWLVAELTAPFTPLGMVGTANLQPSNLHLDSVVRERSFAYVDSTHGALALGRGHYRSDTVGAEPATWCTNGYKFLNQPCRQACLPVSACRLNWIPEDLKTNGTTEIFRRLF